MLNVPITPELIDKHGLTPEEYERIKEIIGREPNLTELGIFSVMWSEHCSYKNSKPLLKQFPTDKADTNSPFGKVLVKAGEENAGVIDIGGGWAICFKIESHNHPSAVEPFEGAATGVGGIIRDIFTMGARPIALTNSLRFGKLDNPENQRLFRGVVHGIAHYGNCIGIPNIGGDIYFDDCYAGNPLVNAQCLGVLRHDQIKRGAASGVGNPVYYVGPPTGRDGLGGAAFASKELSEESASDRPAVQKGDPFMEKLLIEACLEMMAVDGLVVGIQDMGAAGLTCSTCETASRGGAGIEIELDKVPQRETGMNSYEIMLSESQERMLVIVQKGREAELEAIFEKWDLPAAQIGIVTDTGRMVVKQHGSPVVNLPAAELADQAPVYHREAVEPEYIRDAMAYEVKRIPDLDAQGVSETLPKLLSDTSIAEKRWVWQQYDHMVMASTAVPPGSDAGVVRVRLDDGKETFVALANDCNNRYCYLNPYRGAKAAMAECVRNLACSGARPVGMTNNLNFGNPNKPESFYMLREAVKGLSEACRFFDIPVVGGNVSLYNEKHEIKIDPTPVVCLAGLIEKESHITTQHIKTGDESLILLGGWVWDTAASSYLEIIHGIKSGEVPDIDLEAERRLQEFLLTQIAEGTIKAAHDLSEGGLLVALAEMLFAPGKSFGATLDMSVAGESVRLDELLFGEQPSRAIIAVPAADAERIQMLATSAEVPAAIIGRASKEPKITLNLLGHEPVVWDSAQLRNTWERAIPNYMEH